MNDFLNRVFEEQINLTCQVTLEESRTIDWDVADGAQGGGFPHYPVPMVDGNGDLGPGAIPPPEGLEGLGVSVPGDCLLDVIRGAIGGTRLSPEQQLIVNGASNRAAHIHVFMIIGSNGMRSITFNSTGIVSGGFINGYASSDLPALCWVESSRRRGDGGDANVLHTVAHEVGHVIFGSGHPDGPEGGPAPLSENTGWGNRLMLSGKSSLKLEPQGIQVVKGEWDAADQELPDLLEERNPPS